MLKIIFYKTASKYYDQVCLTCENFSNYSYEGDKNTLVLEIEELNKKRKEFDSIYQVVKNWKKVEFYINKNKVNSYDIDEFLRVLDCSIYYDRDEEDGEFCYLNEGWGCQFVDSICLRSQRYNRYYGNKPWFKYGHLENGIWIVDKESIKNKIYSEVKEKNLNICRYFDIDRIKKSIDLLPEKIEISADEDCNWEYEYRESPVGLKKTEIIGVKPKDDGNIYSGGIRIPINFEINTENSDEDKKSNELEKRIPTTTFDDIGGIDDIIQQIRETVELPIISPNIFQHYSIKPHKGILLYGPPGCGKTLIAKAIANEVKAHFIIVNGPEILNKWLGQSEENIRKIFDEARKFSPSVIYFDEFDSIGVSRDNETNPYMAPIVNQLLTLMDGVMVDEKICVIASTNRVDMVDDALKRPGRFDYIIEVKKPTLEGCKKIFEIHTRNMPVDKKFDKNKFVEKNLAGLSGAEIAFVTTEAAYNSVRRTIDTKKVLSGEKYDYVLNNNNIIIEEDFNKAVIELKKERNDYQ